MIMIGGMIIPTSSESSVPLCPHCGRALPEAPASDGLRMFASVILVTLVVGWIVFTVVSWLGPEYGDQQRTLLQVLCDEVKWAWALLHRIY